MTCILYVIGYRDINEANVVRFLVVVLDKTEHTSLELGPLGPVRIGMEHLDNSCSFALRVCVRACVCVCLCVCVCVGGGGGGGSYTIPVSGGPQR